MQNLRIRQGELQSHMNEFEKREEGSFVVIVVGRYLKNLIIV